MRIDRLSHAILFCGEEGSGALPRALSLAQCLHCTGGPTKPCGTCPACKQSAKLVHPDTHFAVPVNRGKGMSSSKPPITDECLATWREAYLANPNLTEQEWYNALDLENKQGSISTAEAQSIIHKLQYKPFESEVKVMIIWLPERMHTAAANKLLKLIEEPPAGTYFFLVSHNPQWLLPTIRSRCMSVQVPAAHLKPLSEAQCAPFEQWLDCCLTQRPAALLDNAEAWAAKGRENQKTFIRDALRVLREYYMVWLGAPQLAQLDPAHKEKIARKVAAIEAPFFETSYQKLNGAMEDIERNVNARALFSSLAFHFYLSLPHGRFN